MQERGTWWRGRSRARADLDKVGCCIREEKLLQLLLWKMVHFALFLVKISINFSPSYSTVFFSHHSGHLYSTKNSKL
jgi:hypothetical protein